jgi:hypothetical protein
MPEPSSRTAMVEAAAQALCAWPSVAVDDRTHNTATHMATDAVDAARAVAAQEPSEEAITAAHEAYPMALRSGLREALRAAYRVDFGPAGEETP